MADRTDNRPFCFFLGSSDPHRPYEPGSGANSGMALDEIQPYGCLPDAEPVRSDVADYYYEVQRFDTLVGAMIRTLEEYGELENTLIVVSGDNGMPFPRCKANNYDTGVRVPFAVRWGTRIRKPGRVLDDFVSFTDLAPTFLEVAGVDIPSVMTGRSFVNLLESEQEGITDGANRGFVLHGKERHVPGQEETMGGYPVRAIRTHDYLYIRNFKPDRWPAGTPNYMQAAIPYCWLADCDNGPTKTYMVENREKDDHHRLLYQLAFGKRPQEELYDCRMDPYQLNNLAVDPAYDNVRRELSELLMEQLRITGDPRAYGGGDEFDEVPYLGQGPRHPSYRPEE